MSIPGRAQNLQRDLVELRRQLHREPELGLNLPRTQEKVLAALDGLPVDVTTGGASTSVTAVLRGGKPGGAILLRGDMDALPLQEKTALDYASHIDDRMHACGHDLHTAGLVGAAVLLSEQRHELHGDVVFMFQPGEEGYDGAGSMIEEGVLDAAGKPLDAAYALHVMSAGLPRGMFSTRRGPFLSACDTVTVTVRGSGGHGSMPHLARDPLPASCEMVLALQTAVTRRFDIADPVVISVGSFHAGGQSNIIAEEVRFEATVRSFSGRAQAKAEDTIVRTVRGIADAHGLEVEIDYLELYPATVNDSKEAEFAAEIASTVHGEDRFVWADRPLPNSEDFSRILAGVPGAFVVLGACPEGVDEDRAPDNHSPLAVFDDSLLADGAALLTELATRRLAATAPSGLGAIG